MQQKKRTDTNLAAGEKQKKEKRHLTVIQWQILLCSVALAAAVVCRFYAPERFDRLRAGYQQYFENADLEEELVRFANAAWDMTVLSVSAEQPAPEGASEKAYVPNQPCVLPVTGAWLSSAYGWRTHPVTKTKTFHRGIDLACAEGTPVLAAMAGSVEYTGYDSSSGNYLKLRHSDGVETVYCHMQYIFVRAGETIAAGQVIGTAGSTGNATGPHLHFALLLNDIYYDPTEMLGLA